MNSVKKLKLCFSVKKSSKISFYVMIEIFLNH